MQSSDDNSVVHSFPEPVTALFQLLANIGLQRYAQHLQAHRIDLPTLTALSNSELRDDLNIVPLAHRRLILQACEPRVATSSIPLFGSILVHLSNMRTFHSFLSNSIQIMVFAFAVLRLAPEIGDAAVSDICGGFLVGVAVLLILYGTTAFYRVTTTIERSHMYRPDWVGIGLVLFCSIVAASITLSIVVLEGIP